MLSLAVVKIERKEKLEFYRQKTALARAIFIWKEETVRGLKNKQINSRKRSSNATLFLVNATDYNNVCFEHVNDFLHSYHLPI